MAKHPVRTPERQQTKPTTPSYARPTASSSRKFVHHEETPSSPDHQLVRSSPRRKLPIRHFDSSKLSTTASRNRARWNGPFRFLDLPPDIRNMIYSYLVRLPSKGLLRFEYKAGHPRISTKDTVDGSVYNAYNTTLLPSLLRVENKQIRDEFGSYFFGHSKILLCVANSDDLAKFLEFIGPRNAERMKYANVVEVLYPWIRCLDLPFMYANYDIFGSSVRGSTRLKRFGPGGVIISSSLLRVRQS